MDESIPLPARFRLLEELHRDAIQVRLRVADETLQREVILELPGRARLRLLDKGDQRARLLREARMLAKVHHPGVQSILDTIEHEGVPMLVLAPRPGRTLAEVLAERHTLEPDEVRRIGIDVARATQAVHAAGVVHRDLREENILIAPDGSCVVTGFGFAKPQGSPFHGTSIDHNRKLVREGGESVEVVPTYPAPEQTRGIAADARCDVYALGCVLVRCLTGEPPDPAATVTAATIRGGARHAPRALTSVLARALSPSPLARFPTMLDLAEALEQCAQGAPAPSRRGLLLAAGMAALALPLGWIAVSALGGTGTPTPVGTGTAALGATDTRKPDDGARGNTPRAGGGGTGDVDRSWYRTAHAVVIGIDYRDAKGGHHVLHNAESDAQAVHYHLLELNWPKQNLQLLLGPQATAQAIHQALARLRVETRPEDQAFLYFAGHGKVYPNLENSGWMLPYDAAPDELGTGRDPENWIHFNNLDRLLGGEIKADHLLIALDCCHSGASIAKDVVRGTPGVLARADAVRWLRGKARLLLAASQANEVASDGVKGTHSPFCQVILDKLAAARDGCVTGLAMRAAVQGLGSITRQRPVSGYHVQSDPDADFLFGAYPK